MKWIIFFCVLILVLFSGCLDLISTREKQLCLSSTDYSETSIYDCSKISDCFKKINSSGWVMSEEIPIDTKNQILIYKNNIASAVYYFNKAKTEIQNINGFCAGEKDLQIIKSINNLFFYISKIFSYEDQAFQKSIEILKNYTIYLKENGVEKINEEEIYTDFVILNQNLNELRDEEIGNESYVSILKREAQKASELAKEFGFAKSYMSSVNYIDIYAYYKDYIDNPEQELKLPIISKSSNFVFSKLSTFENFRKINTNLSKADNYNLYILFDKHLGANDSLFKKFIELNNKINIDLKIVFERIASLEKNINEDINYLSSDDQDLFLDYKQKYSRNQLKFGFYLAKLKELSATLEDTKLTAENENSILNTKLKYCDIVIKDAKDYNNWYFKVIIENYNLEKNGVAKLEYCQKLKDALSNRNCLSNYSKLISLGYLEDANLNIDFECIDVLNQYNYILEDDTQILLYFTLISENKNVIESIKTFELNFDTQILLLDYEDKIEGYQKYPNYKIIINIDSYLSELNKINKQLLKIWQGRLLETVLKNYEIVYSDNGYVLKIENPGTLTITDFCFSPNDINLAVMNSLDSSLKINKNEICIDILVEGINTFKINYKNQRTISTKVITLSLDQSLLEAIIQNKVIGVVDTLNLGQVVLIDPLNYKLTENQEIEYITQKENKILYYAQILAITNLEQNTNTESNETILVDKFRIKNVYPEEFCGELVITNCQNCVALVKENGNVKNTNAYKEYGKLSINTCFKIQEEKTIEINLIEDLAFVDSEVQDILSRINLLNNCEFSDISTKSKMLLPEIGELLPKNNYTFEEINKIYSLRTKLSVLEKEYKQKLQLIDNINLIISQILELQLTADEEIELNKIEELINTTPIEAYKKIIALENTISARYKTQENIKNTDFKNKIKNLIDLGKNTDTIDSETINKLNALTFSENNQIELVNIEAEINEKIKNKSKETNEYINYFAELDKTNILDAIDEVNWVYADITLADLYAVKYYPIITVDDATRLKKKLSYLDTVSFKENNYDFSKPYSINDYSEALQNTDVVSIDRLKDLNNEINLVINGLAQFKKDATTELNNLNNSKIAKIQENTTKIETIKKDYENKKYLTVITNIKLLNTRTAPVSKINYQLFAIAGVFFVVAISAAIFGKKGRKKLSKEDKKQKILRHY
ncbi:MAG: hypothetical protein WCX82_02535 [archaeon]